MIYTMCCRHLIKCLYLAQGWLQMEHVDDQHEWTTLMDGVLNRKGSGYMLVNNDTTLDIGVQGGNPPHKLVPEAEALKPKGGQGCLM